MEAAVASETSVNLYHSIRRNPEDSHLNSFSFPAPNPANDAEHLT
jgi:hypothetical protein